jgi:hypothetical protein
VSRLSRVRLWYQRERGLAASSPVEPVRGVAGRAGPGAQGGEEALDLRDGQRDHPGARWRYLAGKDRRGSREAVPRLGAWAGPRVPPLTLWCKVS